MFSGARRVRTVRTGSAAVDKTAISVRRRPEPGLLLAARRRLRDVRENAAAKGRIALRRIDVQGDYILQLSALYMLLYHIITVVFSMNLCVIENINIIFLHMCNLK